MRVTDEELRELLRVFDGAFEASRAHEKLPADASVNEVFLSHVADGIRAVLDRAAPVIEARARDEAFNALWRAMEGAGMDVATAAPLMKRIEASLSAPPQQPASREVLDPGECTSPNCGARWHTMPTSGTCLDCDAPCREISREDFNNRTPSPEPDEAVRLTVEEQVPLYDAINRLADASKRSVARAKAVVEINATVERIIAQRLAARDKAAAQTKDREAYEDGMRWAIVIAQDVSGQRTNTASAVELALREHLAALLAARRGTP